MERWPHERVDGSVNTFAKLDILVSRKHAKTSKLSTTTKNAAADLGATEPVSSGEGKLIAEEDQWTITKESSPSFCELIGGCL